METNIPEKIQEVMQKFIDNNYQIYIVGGAIRDILLNRKVYDWDFTTDATPEQILELYPDGYSNNKFGTVGVSIMRGDSERGAPTDDRSEARTHGGAASWQDPEQATIVEITTMRKEGDYKDHRHPSEVEWTNKLEEDLTRRDFTINAMALDIEGNITDLYSGQEDLDKRLIKAVRDPDLRFQEDALRIIKAFRLVSQLDFKIEENTFNSIIKNKDLILEISWERIRDEFLKLLGGGNPHKALELMRSSGILEIILPELTKCFNIKQEGPKHDRVYDVGEHSLLTLKETPSKDPLVRFAALLHDIGKADTVNIQPDGNVTFYNHDVVGGRLALQIAKRFNLSKKQTDKLFKLVRWHLFSVDEHQTDSAIRRFVTNIGVENIKDMYDLRIGDRLGGGTQRAVSWRMDDYFNKRIPSILHKPFSITDLKIDGKDIMETLNIPPGKKIGEILQKLFEEVLEDPEKNNREYLLEKIKTVSYHSSQN